MTATPYQPRKLRPTRIEAPSHRFEVGQAVHLKGGMQRPLQADDLFHITGKLPPRGDSPQYRIRCEAERYERVATEDSLEVSEAVEGSDTANLIARTFTD